jgi:hypothetical protein
MSEKHQSALTKSFPQVHFSFLSISTLAEAEVLITYGEDLTISGRSPLYMTRAMEIFHYNLRVYIEQKGTYINLINLSKGY